MIFTSIKPITPNRETRLDIYKEMLEQAILNKKIAEHVLLGLCPLLRIALIKLDYNPLLNYSKWIDDYPELIALKPKKKAPNEVWWSVNKNSNIRIMKLKKIINELETKITK